MSRELGPDISSCPLCGSTTLRDVPGLPASVWCVDCGIVAVESLCEAAARLRANERDAAEIVAALEAESALRGPHTMRALAAARRIAGEDTP